MSNKYLSYWFKILITFLCITPILVVAQQKKKFLSNNEYDLFGELSLSSISENGQWICCHMAYDNGKDTLVVKSTNSQLLYKLPLAREGSFIGDDVFVARTPDNYLWIKQLYSGKTVKTPHIQHYDILKKSGYIVAKGEQSGETYSLQIFSSATGLKVEEVNNVIEYAIDKKSEKLVCVTSQKDLQTIFLFNLKKLALTKIFEKQDVRLSRLTWKDNGEVIAFLSQIENFDKSVFVNLYEIEKQKISTYNFSNANATFSQSITMLRISNDGQKVIIGTQNEETNENDEALEVWNGNDKEVYPLLKSLSNDQKSKLLVWEIGKDDLLSIDNEMLTIQALTGSQQYAIFLDPLAYAPQYKLSPDADFYSVDLNTGHRKIILKKHPSSQEYTSVSPYSNDIAYYSNGQWWIYQQENDSNLCLTGEINSKWDTTGTHEMPPIQPYGCAGWTKDGKNILLYDKWDIWLVQTNGKTFKKLTSGSSSKIIFRLLPQDATFSSYKVADYIFKDGLVLLGKSIDDNSENYYRWTSKNGLYKISKNSGSVRQARISDNGDLAYIWERYDIAPEVYINKKEKVSSKIVYKSNSLQSQFAWGHSELIYFKDRKGRQSKAALFYPAQYRAGRQYPMITFIYQQMSERLHKYVKPSLASPIGFNITDYTLDGYFVLLPDITYKEGDPGVSASESVIAAVEEVIRLGLADRKAIGLIGTSFGGYETSFILTQTNIFSTAVCGAGISDIVGMYFTVGEQILKPEAWRFENQIFRMGSTFFDNKEAYIRNSTLHNANFINNPLLLWCGKEDTVVPWQQSLYLYTALRRLGKSSILLAYRQESHALMQIQNQLDLSKRVHQWFDHFLKNNPSSWISAGINDKL